MSDTSFWTEYVNERFDAFYRSLETTEWTGTPVASEELKALISDSSKSLRKLDAFIHKDAINRFRFNFHSANYRRKNSKRTISISNESYAQLVDFAKGYDDITTPEDVLRVLFNPIYREDTDQAKHEFASTDEIPSSELTEELTSLVMRLAPRDKAIIKQACVSLFKDAWSSAKRSRSQKKNAGAVAMTKHPLIKASQILTSLDEKKED
ncbi:MAG: hypothetical protein GJ680_18415 [Alteromonadaceae bacterium]|nr:hypothetical protein [Alteromonadaceae bacterium]